MSSYILNINDKIYANNNDIMLEIVNNLQQIINNTKDNTIIKRLGDVINKMKNMMAENKKNFEILRKDISKLNDNVNKQFSELKINKDTDKQELVFDNGRRYVGQVLNGLPEGKGIWYINTGERYEGEFRDGKYNGRGIFYGNDNSRYEGEFKNDMCEGKGIYYYGDGRRYEGDFRNDKLEGKGIMFYNDGEIFMGDWRNGKKEGKGIFYFNNGDREMGDWSNDKEIGKHIILTNNGEVQEQNY